MTTLQPGDDGANVNDEVADKPAPKVKAKATEGIIKVDKGRIVFYLVGTNPIILNRMSQKTRQTLLFPAGRKTAADKQSTLKHKPMDEFRDSPYRMPPEADVLLGHLSSAFKSAMCTAALDLPGAKKAQIGRLVYVVGNMVGVYGVPMLFMSPVRSADINHTPDIRTRAIVPRWAAKLTVEFVTPLLRSTDVINVLVAAGYTAGVGDWRPEKGKGDFGQFKIVDEGDEEWLEIVASGGRAVQEAAMEKPEYYDLETEGLITWYDLEVDKRGFTPTLVENVDDLDDDDEALEAAGS